MSTLAEELLHGMAQKADTFTNGQLAIKFTRVGTDVRASVGELLSLHNGQGSAYSPRFVNDFRSLVGGDINQLVEQTAEDLAGHSSYFHILVGDEIVRTAKEPSRLIMVGVAEYTYKRYEEVSNNH